MTKLGDSKRGREIGYKGNPSRLFVWAQCKDCDKERWVPLEVKRNKPRSQRCHKCQAIRVARQRPGRTYTSEGYILIKLQPNSFFYPMANSISYVLEHRLVVARALNRCLLPWETVHHKEGYAKDDNRYPETLVLFPHQSTHHALTRMMKYIKKLEREVERLKANEKIVTPISAEDREILEGG